MTTLKSLLAELWGLLLKVGGFYEKHGVPAVAATAGFVPFACFRVASHFRRAFS